MSVFSGHLQIRAARRAHGRTVLAEQAFRAPFHLSKPYWDADAGVLITQVVNPTAGILTGDQLASDITVDSGAALLVTTPSASRIFTMREGSAESRQRFAVAEGGWLEVLPEPLVPHRASRFRQVTQVELAPGGGLFFVDQLTPGRVRHRGEAWLWDRLQLELEVRLGGELVLRERLDQTGEQLRILADLAGSGPSACFANAILLAPEAPPATQTTTASNTLPWKPALAALHGDGLWLGVSALRRGGWSPPPPIRRCRGSRTRPRVTTTCRRTSSRR